MSVDVGDDPAVVLAAYVLVHPLEAVAAPFVKNHFAFPEISRTLTRFEGDVRGSVDLASFTDRTVMGGAGEESSRAPFQPPTWTKAREAFVMRTPASEASI